jgi:hypothetical protein
VILLLLLCSWLQFAVYCSFFGGRISLSRGLCWFYPNGGRGNSVWCLALTCLVSQMSCRQVWSQSLVAVGALLFSQWNIMWRSYSQARGSGCRSFVSHLCFISTKCGSSISAKFWSHGAHAVCYRTLVTILDPPSVYKFFEYFLLLFLFFLSNSSLLHCG